MIVLTSSDAPSAHGVVPQTEVPVSDEFRLLLLCSGTRVTTQQRDLMRSLAGGELDWEFVLGKAYWHALTPLLYRNLNALCADRVPAPVLEQLETHYVANAKRNLALTGELVKVLRILESANIAVVPYKGPALAALAYGDVALRKFCDLDLIVRSRDVFAAKSLLVAQGYQWRPSKPQRTGRDEWRNLNFWNEYKFVHPGKNAPVDLHWGISSRRFPVNIDLDSLWEHLDSMRLAGQDVRTFPPEVTLLLLCIHGSKDLWWRRLGWVCDIAELLAAIPRIDWSNALQLASETGTRRMFLLGVALAGDLLQAPVPDQVWSWIRSDRAVVRLNRHVHHRLFDEPTTRVRMEKPRFHLRVRERLRDRIPVLFRLLKGSFRILFVPDEQDRQWVKLSRPLSGLYCLVRPVRLVYRLWLRSTRRSDTRS